MINHDELKEGETIYVEHFYSYTPPDFIREERFGNFEATVIKVDKGGLETNVKVKYIAFAYDNFLSPRDFVYRSYPEYLQHFIQRHEKDLAEIISNHEYLVGKIKNSISEAKSLLKAGTK